MSKYSEQLGRLKKEISIIQSKKKVKFKKHQKDMINFIHRIITNVEFTVYKMEKNQKDLRLVTNEIKDDKLVVTSYRKS